MSQYTETMEALETIDESELTASELSIHWRHEPYSADGANRSRLIMRGDAENELLEQADHRVACGSADLYSVRLRAVADPTDYGDETAFEADLNAGKNLCWKDRILCSSGAASAVTVRI